MKRNLFLRSAATSVLVSSALTLVAARDLAGEQKTQSVSGPASDYEAASYQAKNASRTESGADGNARNQLPVVATSDIKEATAEQVKLFSQWHLGNMSAVMREFATESALLNMNFTHDGKHFSGVEAALFLLRVYTSHRAALQSKPVPKLSVLRHVTYGQAKAFLSLAVDSKSADKLKTDKFEIERRVVFFGFGEGKNSYITIAIKEGKRWRSMLQPYEYSVSSDTIKLCR